MPAESSRRAGGRGGGLGVNQAPSDFHLSSLNGARIPSFPAFSPRLETDRRASERLIGPLFLVQDGVGRDHRAEDEGAHVRQPDDGRVRVGPASRRPGVSFRAAFHCTLLFPHSPDLSFRRAERESAHRRPDAAEKRRRRRIDFSKRVVIYISIPCHFSPPLL